MQYFQSKSVTANAIYKKMTLTLLIFQIFSPMQAATLSNYAEMGLALATIPFGIAAQKHTLAKDTKKAAGYHAIANSLSIVNKILYVGNNMYAQKKCGAIGPIRRDLLVNYSLAFVDLKNLLKNLKQLLLVQKNKPVNNNNNNNITSENFLDFDFEEDELQDELFEEITFQEDSPEITQEDDESTAKEEEEEELSQLEQRWLTIGLPSLKGLTALALACAQDNATPFPHFSKQEARYFIASAHLLTSLLAEYSQSKSVYKKILKALMMLNTTWLAYEAVRYYQSIPRAQSSALFNRPEEPLVPLQRQYGLCSVCYDGADLLQLHCGHAVCCQGCLNDQINAHALNIVPCPEQGCTERINRNELRNITNDNPQIIAAYDSATEATNNRMTPGEAALGEAKICPGPGCGIPIYRTDGCQHMTCNQCNFQFCWVCRGNFNGGRGPCFSYKCNRWFDWEI